MAVSIEGARLAKLSLARDEKGVVKFTGEYDLVTTTGVSLARQTFNGAYSDGVTLAASPATAKLINDLVAAVTADLNLTLGLT